MQPADSKTVSRLAGSLLWLVAGLCFYLAGRSIPRESFAGAADPGPALVPMVGAGLLFVGGLLDASGVLIAHVLTRRTKLRLDNQPTGVSTTSAPRPQSKAVRVQGVLLPAIAVLLWGFTLPWIGFAISCWCFVAIWLVASRAKWWQIILIPTLLDATVLLLFGQLFEVQLPRGVWGWP